MKIIKDGNNTVVYFGAALVLTAQHASNGEWSDKATTTSNAVLETVENPPADLQGGHYRHVAGVWTRTAAGAAAHAAKLAAGRAEAWERIKALRDRLSDSGGYKVPVAGVDKWFHSDAKSKTQQLGLVVMGSNVPPVPWKTMDGSKVTMSLQLAAQIFQAAAAQDMAIFAAAEAHKAAMEAAADPLAYDFSAGWPATYGG